MEIIYRKAADENTEIRVVSNGKTFNVVLWDNDAEAAAPFVTICKTREQAIAKAEKIAAGGAVSVPV